MSGVPTWTSGQVLTANDVNNWFVPLAAYKASATPRTSSTPSIDPDLQLSVAASVVYEIDCALIYSASASGGGFLFQWTIPSGSTGGFTATFSQSGNAVNTYGYAWSETSANSATPDTSAYGVIIKGTLITSTTAGTFGVNWSNGTGTHTLTLGVGSLLVARRIS